MQLIYIEQKYLKMTKANARKTFKELSKLIASSNASQIYIIITAKSYSQSHTVTANDNLLFLSEETPILFSVVHFFCDSSLRYVLGNTVNNFYQQC